MPKQFTRFTEKKIHEAINKKVPGELVSKRSKHPVKAVELDGVLLFFMKYPNNHSQSYLNPKESKRIAGQLKLESDDYNRMIDCDLKTKELLEHLRGKFPAA